MAVKVQVKNFQSLKDVELEIEGFTALSGPNNSGKSALMRAIRGVFQNTGGTSFITHGEKEMEVSLSFSDGRSLVWSKGTSARSKPTYVIDGGKPIHPGRGVPEEVRDFNVNPIRVMNQDVYPTLAPQFTGQVFLLDQPGSALAEAVADVDRVSRLNASLRASDKDLRAATNKLKVRREDKEDLEASLEKFDGFDSVETALVSIEEDLAKVEKTERALEKMTEFKQRLNNSQAVVDKYSGVEGVSLPNVSESKQLSGELGVLVELQAALVDKTRAVALYEGVEGVELPQLDSAEADGHLADLKDLGRLRDLYSASKATVDSLQGLDSVDVPDLDTGKPEKAIRLKEFLTDAQERRAKRSGEIADLETELEELEAEYSEADKEVASLLEELGECPTCGSKLDHGGCS